MFFPVSGVETPIWVPPVVAFVVSFFTSMGGVSGAFLLLPFQMSVLGFTSPAVSATNLVYNIVAIPGGVARFLREKRMVWPLTWVVVIGTFPGVIAGGFIRLHFLPDPAMFEIFAGSVLLYVGARLLMDIAGSLRKPPAVWTSAADDWTTHTVEFNWRRVVLRFQGEDFACPSPGLGGLAFVVGVIGGIYGIGGGAIVAPFLVAIFGLPVHMVAGATLMGTFITSVVGVAFYQLVAPVYQAGGLAVAPDWALGALFGLGGLAGTALGARTQRFVPAVWIKVILGVTVLTVAGRYLTINLF